MSEAEATPVTKRLDAVLRLLLDRRRENNKEVTIGDQILVLMDSGLGQGEAGSILGVESNQVPGYLRSVRNKQLYKKLKESKDKAKVPRR